MHTWNYIHSEKKKEENLERNVRHLYNFQLSRLIIKLLRVTILRKSIKWKTLNHF